MEATIMTQHIEFIGLGDMGKGMGIVPLPMPCKVLAAGVTRVISRLPAVNPPNDLPFTVDVNVLEEVRDAVLAAIANLSSTAG